MKNYEMFINAATEKDFLVESQMNDKVNISFIVPGEDLHDVDDDYVSFFNMQTGSKVEFDLNGAVYDRDAGIVSNGNYYTIEVIDKVR